MAKINIDYYGDKKVNNAIKKLIKKYGWYTNEYLSYDWGRIFYKRNYDFEVKTNINGISIYTPSYLSENPNISYQEIRLFKKISDYYKLRYEENQKLHKKLNERKSNNG